MARGCDGLYREAKTKIIYFRQYRKGRGEKKESLKTRDIEEAKANRDELIKQWIGETARRFEIIKALEKQSKTALELLDGWILRKEDQNKSPGTLTSIRSSRRFFKPYLESMMPHEITAEWWETVFIRETRMRLNKDGKRVVRKFFNDRKWLLGFLRQLFDDGLIEKVPKFINPDPKVSVGKVYSDQEVMDLLNFAQNEDLLLAIRMAVTMGMRRGEIFGLKANRVDIEKRLISLRREDVKTRRQRTFSISGATYPFLAARALAGSPWIFPKKDDKSRPLDKDGFYTAWRNLKRTCGIVGRFHDLRHTFLTKAFNAPGANAAQICAYAGVSLEVAERVYLHLTEEDSRRVGELVTYE